MAAWLDKDIYRLLEVQDKAYRLYGDEFQTVVACEELAELIQELTKLTRYMSGDGDAHYDIDHLREEIADVVIVLVGMIQAHSVIDGTEWLADAVNAKVERLDKRIESERTAVRAELGHELTKAKDAFERGRVGGVGERTDE